MEVVFIVSDGRKFVVEAAGANSLMRAAVDADVPGIIAECGGSCSCGTCHVYIDSAWQSKLPAPGPAEASMLEAFGTARPNSRLACQIELNGELDGLTVEVPESQY
jgi:ferredoxin, 2Fe-2S